MYLSPWGSAPTCFLGLLLAQICYKYQKTEKALQEKEHVDVNGNKTKEINENQGFNVSLKCYSIPKKLVFIKREYNT